MTSSSPPRLSDVDHPDVDEEEEETCHLLSGRLDCAEREENESLEASSGPLAYRPCVSVNTPSPPFKKETWGREGEDLDDLDKDLKDLDDSGIGCAASLDLLPISTGTHTASSRGPN